MYCDVVEKLAVTVVTELSVKAAGVSVQFVATAPDETLQLTVTGALNPAIGVSVAVVDIPSPAITVPELGLSHIVKSTPLPLIVAVNPL